MTSSKSPTWNTDSKVRGLKKKKESLACSLDISLKESISHCSHFGSPTQEVSLAI